MQIKIGCGLAAFDMLGAAVEVFAELAGEPEPLQMRADPNGPA